MAASYPSSVASFPTRTTGNAIPAADHNGPASEITAIETALLEGADHIIQALGFQFEAATTKVLASDTLTINGESYVSVDTQGAAASDTLSTITAGAPTHGIAVADGFLLMLKPENASHVVTVTTGGNIVLASDMVFSAVTDRLLLQYNGTNWVEVCRAPVATIEGIDTSVDGKPKFTNYAGTSGVVLDVNTDGTVKVYQRDGSTPGALQAGAVSDSIGSLATVRSGGLSVTSQAQYDLLYASSASQLARIPNGTTGQVLTATTSGAPSWAAAPGAAVLLRSGTGTSTSAGVTTLDSFSVSGLSNKDSIKVMASAGCPSNNITNLQVVDSTTATVWGQTTSTAQSHMLKTETMRCKHGGAEQMKSICMSGTGTTLNTSTFGNDARDITSTFTLALKWDGIGGGDTGTWTWQVWKVAG